MFISINMFDVCSLGSDIVDNLTIPTLSPCPSCLRRTTGPVPFELANLQKLKSLVVAENMFSGEMLILDIVSTICGVWGEMVEVSCGCFWPFFLGGIKRIAPYCRGICE